MRLRARPVVLPAFLPALTVACALALAPVPARADAALEALRYDLADRRATPLSANDAGLARAGLAVDPLSALSVNPALLSLGGPTFRASGELIEVSRNDLRAATVDYDEASGFPAVGEAGVRGKVKGLTLGAWFAQPQYEHEENQFVGFRPGKGGGDPFVRRNEWTSATREFGGGASLRLKNGMVVGLAVQGVALKDDFQTVPDVPAGSVADTFAVECSATVPGGAAGVAMPIAGKWVVGGAYRFAGDATYDGGGGSDGPQSAHLGVKYGRTAGSQVFAGWNWQGARTLDFGTPEVAPLEAKARSEYGVGYAYDDPAGGFGVRIGYAYSPRPADEAVQFTRFGIAGAFGVEDLRVSLAYGLESENRPGDVTSSRSLFQLGFSLGR